MMSDDPRVEAVAEEVWPLLNRGMKWGDRRLAWWRVSEARYVATKILAVADAAEKRT
jgi:hypothetical protein